jgi:ketosteroid isomerase-like protein
MDERRHGSPVLDESFATTRAAFVAALRSGDAKAATAVYAGNARLLAPSAELLRGSEAIEAFWRAGIEAGISGVELNSFELEYNDGLAYEIGRYALQLEPAEGGTVVDRGNYLLVHERQEDGSWRWAVEMFNPDSSPAAASVDETGKGAGR